MNSSGMNPQPNGHHAQQGFHSVNANGLQQVLEHPNGAQQGFHPVNGPTYWEAQLQAINGSDPLAVAARSPGPRLPQQLTFNGNNTTESMVAQQSGASPTFARLNIKDSPEENGRKRQATDANLDKQVAANQVMTAETTQRLLNAVENIQHRLNAVENIQYRLNSLENIQRQVNAIVVLVSSLQPIQSNSKGSQ